MTRDDWQQHHGFIDEEMLDFEYYISQGCKITNIFEYGWEGYIKNKRENKLT